jgi:hypothetical protein
VDLLDLLAFIGLVIWRRYPGLTTAVARPGDRVRRFEQVLRRMWGFQELPSQDAVRLTTLWMRTSERIASGSSVPVLARDDFQTLWSAAS